MFTLLKGMLETKRMPVRGNFQSSLILGWCPETPIPIHYVRYSKNVVFVRLTAYATNSYLKRNGLAFSAVSDGNQ